MATQFTGKIFTYTQPDGRPIQVRGWGDQNYAVFETLNGYTVTQNPATGDYEVAQVSADGNVLQPAPSPALTPRFLHGKRAPRLEAVEPSKNALGRASSN